jgi:ABC-type multidrug transport system ATPase subunit
VIALDHVSARRASSWLANVTLAFGPGIHALVGGRDDGGSLMLSVLAGEVRVRRGRARILRRPPGDARTRAKIGRVPLEPAMPAELRVREFLAVAAEVRGEPQRPASERLATLGIEVLAERPIRSLSRGEARAASLAEAVTSPGVQVLLVEEPFVAMDPRAAGLVAAALRDKARSGAAVLVATASLRDAGDLADDHVLMRAGVPVAQLRSLVDVVGFSPAGARLGIYLRTVADARALVAAIAHDASVDGVDRDDAVVKLRGSDVVWLARAAASASFEAGVDVLEIAVSVPGQEEARAAAAGIAAATYEAAYRRTRAAARPDSAEPKPEGTP